MGPGGGGPSLAVPPVSPAEKKQAGGEFTTGAPVLGGGPARVRGAGAGLRGGKKKPQF